jgi:hypothetical protein
MSELKFTLPSFDGKPSSDFHLWQLRLQAILESKSLWYVIEPTPTSVASAEDNRKAAAIIINGLGDKPLRSVSAHTKEPQAMVKRLRERYASTKLSTRMSLMAELQAMRYKTGDMAEYVDKYAALLDRLEAMNAKVPSDLAIIMFLHSMDGKFEGTITALRTLGDDKLTWDDVTARLIEEFNTSVKGQSSGGNATALVTSASKKAAVCTRCGKTGHEVASCWWNPDNPRNKLGNSNRTSDSKSRVNNASTKNEAGRAKSSHRHHSSSTSKKSKNSKEKVLMLNMTSHKKSGNHEFLLDSGASSHMSPQRDWLHNMHPIQTREIMLGNDATVSAEAAGDMILRLPYRDGKTLKLVISDVLYVPDLGINLLSCSRLAMRGVASVFNKDECTLIDKNDNDDVLNT